MTLWDRIRATIPTRHNQDDEVRRAQSRTDELRKELARRREELLAATLKEVKE